MKLYGIIGLILLGLCAGLNAAHADAHPTGDGTISLYSYHTGDVLEITFRNPQGYDQEALKKINYLMRSRGDGQIHAIDPKLIDLLDAIQDHFGAETVEVISGYRSKPFNELLRENGRGAASESYHTKGMAADIHIDEVTEKALWDYAKNLGAGGAGLYPTYNFIHVDVGPTTRVWSEPTATRRILTGTDLSPNQGWSVLTDKNIYRKDEPVKITIRNELLERESLVKNYWYDRFRRGKWSEHKVIEKSKGVARLSTGEEMAYTWDTKDLPHGKYRFVVFPSRDFSVPPAYSNEFYIKKQ